MTRTSFIHLGLSAALSSLLAGCIIDSDDSNTGQFRATWSLVSEDGQAMSCAQAAVASVSILSTEQSSGFGHDDIFLCTDMGGVTAPLPVDQYTVVAAALDANDANLSQSVPFGATVNCSGCLIDLPAVVFLITPG